MGYYAMLVDTYIEEGTKIRIEEKEKLLNEIEEKCNLGFSSANFKTEIDSNGNIQSFNVEEPYTKWYDEEAFEEILSKYLLSGRVSFEFEGEDKEEWKSDIFPKTVVVTSPNWQEDNIKTIKNLDIEQNIKNKLLTEYKEYWKKQLKEATNKLKAIEEELGK